MASEGHARERMQSTSETVGGRSARRRAGRTSKISGYCGQARAICIIVLQIRLNVQHDAKAGLKYLELGPDLEELGVRILVERLAGRKGQEQRFEREQDGHDVLAFESLENLRQFTTTARGALRLWNGLFDLRGLANFGVWRRAGGLCRSPGDCIRCSCLFTLLQAAQGAHGAVIKPQLQAQVKTLQAASLARLACGALGTSGAASGTASLDDPRLLEQDRIV
mmetsp:Transcript_3026/g.7545  ORF Transcript_3026/g.7545 Transcript_3026/m.7545 type:complete len:223 (+) Transcript_3026:179-847(+)